jgi:hypothetical protein
VTSAGHEAHRRVVPENGRLFAESRGVDEVVRADELDELALTEVHRASPVVRKPRYSEKAKNRRVDRT